LPPRMSVEIPRYRSLLTDHGQHTMLARVTHHAGRFHPAHAPLIGAGDQDALH
jgi:hypothetical protein